MMRLLTSRFIGVALIIAAIIGLVFSLGGMYVTLRYKDAVSDAIVETLTLVNETLDATAEGLAIVNQTLGFTVDSIASLESSIRITAQAFKDSTPMIESLSSALGDELPQTIQAAQTSLETAMQSAKIVDTVLTALTSIPFVNIGKYDPEVPLNAALGKIGESLASLPDKLTTMSESLSKSSSNFTTIQTDITGMAENIANIKTSMEQASGVIESYQNSVDTLQSQVAVAIEKTPSAVNVAAWVIVIFLVWLAIAQLGLLTQGLERFQARSETPALPASEAEPIQIQPGGEPTGGGGAKGGADGEGR